MYDTMLRDIEINERKVNWAFLVRQLLCNLGFREVWLQQNVGNCNAFLAMFRQRVRDIFVQNWTSEFDNSSRALFYRSFSNFKFQSYLEFISVKKFRVVLSKLRVSSHKLECEAGRWARPVRVVYDERKCRVCNILEDEFHFIFECPVYSNLRKLYIDKYYINRHSNRSDCT